MKHERFNGAISAPAVDAPSVADAWLFDMKATHSDADRQVARYRLAQVRYIPLLMLIAHVIAAGLLYSSLHGRLSGAMEKMLAALLVIDVVAILALQFRK